MAIPKLLEHPANVADKEELMKLVESSANSMLLDDRKVVTNREKGNDATRWMHSQPFNTFD